MVQRFTGRVGGTNGGATSSVLKLAPNDELACDSAFKHEIAYPISIRPSVHPESFAAARVSDLCVMMSYPSDPPIMGIVQVRKPSGPPSIPGRCITQS